MCGCPPVSLIINGMRSRTSLPTAGSSMRIASQFVRIDVADIGGFVAAEPTTENHFRSVVLFGRNVASYKFALAKSLIALAREGRDVVPLPDLAVPFAGELCAHLEAAPKQATSSSSRFLDVCREFIAGEISDTQLRESTARLGFVNVIDAFHIVGPGEIPVRFFIDERRARTPSIRLTDAMHDLASSAESGILDETEARWRLVETAWDLGTSASTIEYDQLSGFLVTSTRRRSITRARHALAGYQKGKCFYCYRPIEIITGSVELADVDHLFPHVLQRLRILSNLDGVWNLVLACPTCNRGPAGKFDRTPHHDYVGRLHRRNEYLILSHHPLRQTLIAQTGRTPEGRQQFLQRVLTTAGSHQVSTWQTTATADPAF